MHWRYKYMNDMYLVVPRTRILALLCANKLRHFHMIFFRHFMTSAAHSSFSMGTT